MKMKTNELDMLREMLQGELNALLERARLTVGQLVDEVYIYEADPLDRATEEQAQNERMRIRDRESRLIAKIRRSLDAMDEGTYGICESCEEPIGIDRLRARPVTTYCIDCKTRQEALERLTGT
jgi:DnaK suppressor protein